MGLHLRRNPSLEVEAEVENRSIFNVDSLGIALAGLSLHVQGVQRMRIDERVLS